MAATGSLHVLFVLPGAHRVRRGAEVAFESVADELARRGDRVTLIGGGPARSDRAYAYLEVPHRPRERFERHPTFPPLRTDIHWEQLAFTAALARAPVPRDADVTVACDFPFVHWWLRGLGRVGSRPRHVYVTENGDWPAHDDRSEFRFFACDGLVCTNPVYLRRNEGRHRCRLIPNGVDTGRFAPGPPARERFGLPDDRPVVLVVAALTPYKRVLEAVEVVAQVPDAFLVVAGDGPQRAEVDAAAGALLPGRFRRLSVDPDAMPELYRSADALVHLAREEPFGNVYVEALATGLPVVAAAGPGTAWIVGDDGHLVDGDDLAAAADAVSRALATPPGEAVGRAERCAERFGWPRVAAAYRELLADVAAGPGRRPLTTRRPWGRRRAPARPGPAAPAGAPGASPR